MKKSIMKEEFKMKKSIMKEEFNKYFLEIYHDSKNDYSFIITNSNNEIVDFCSGYPNKHDCLNAAKINCPEEPEDFIINKDMIFSSSYFENSFCDIFKQTVLNLQKNNILYLSASKQSDNFINITVKKI